ncbi:unnamed protein product [Mytilus edulis]|uniref:Ig-like domain-containing protein n=1 Tax=Mytilus edulis TaxID=6550 RepID=A0A8S3QHM8_MYTED|nr:unnamed protein product [Mytilus edulis]
MQCQVNTALYAQKSYHSRFQIKTLQASSQIPPGPPAIDGPPVLVLNAQITLLCRSARGDPPPTVKCPLESDKHNTVCLCRFHKLSCIFDPQRITYCVINAPVNQYTPTLQTTVTLQCDVTQGTASQIIWIKDNIQLNIGTNSRFTGGNVATESLTINNVQQSDGGNYVCTPPITSIPQPSYTQISGQQIILGCTVNSPNSPPTGGPVDLYCNNQETNDRPYLYFQTQWKKYSGSSVNGPSLTIETVLNPTDQGYTVANKFYLRPPQTNPATSLTVTEVRLIYENSKVYINK